MRHRHVAVERSRCIDIETDNRPGWIDGEGVGERGIERRAARDVDGDRANRAPVLQESVFVAVGVVIQAYEVCGRIDSPSLRKRAAGNVIPLKCAVVHDVAVVLAA